MSLSHNSIAIEILNEEKLYQDLKAYASSLNAKKIILFKTKVFKFLTTKLFTPSKLIERGLSKQIIHENIKLIKQPCYFNLMSIVIYPTQKCICQVVTRFIVNTFKEVRFHNYLCVNFYESKNDLFLNDYEPIPGICDSLIMSQYAYQKIIFILQISNMKIESFEI